MISAATTTSSVASTDSGSGGSGDAGLDGTGAVDSTTGMSTGPAEPVCPGVTAVFFDLGETLVDDGVELPGAVELVAALKEAGILVGIITNVPAGFTAQDLRDLLEKPDFLEAFDLILMSSQAGSNPKPDAAIFTEAHALLPGAPSIDKVAFVTEELDHIANLERGPTIGARAAGMVGVHLSSGEASPLADHTVDPADLLSIADAPWLGCN